MHTLTKLPVTGKLAPNSTFGQIRIVGHVTMTAPYDTIKDLIIFSK